MDKAAKKLSDLFEQKYEKVHGHVPDKKKPKHKKHQLHGAIGRKIEQKQKGANGFKI